MTAIVVGVCAATVTAVWLVRTSAPPVRASVAPLRLGGAAIAPGAVPSARRWQLDDGSSVTLSERAELEVVSNDDGRFVTKLARGRARFDVKPGGPRQWSIETSLATVEVVGTAFDVDDASGQVTVRVDRGVVLVRGERVPGRIVRLVAGQELVLHADPALHSAAVPAPAPPAVAPPLPPLPAVAPPPAAVVTPAGEPRPGRALAAALAESDELRAHGRARDAAELLARAIAEHPDDAGVGVAAFSLGRLYLEVLGEPGLAADAFARVLRAGRPRGLLEDAHARRTEALISAGRRDEAARALAQLEAAFPASARVAPLRVRLAATSAP
jgi:transmembrane sensor